MKKTLLAFAAIALFLASCGNKTQQEEQPTASGLLASKFEGTTDEGDSTRLYVMKNASGMEVCVTNIGGRIVSVMVPDRAGNMQDVVLGFDNIENYKPISNYFGALIGRYSNRIAKGTFLLDRVNYKLVQNAGNNNLHGGPRGFHARCWTIDQPDPQTLVCTLFSRDGDQGFPGNLDVTVTYTLTDDNAIDINYSAVSDRNTLCSLSSHSYFNLSGDPNNTILDHILFIDANKYTPVNEEMIPTGKIDPVKGTPLDFTTAASIGDRIDDTSFDAIKFGKGYDHNFVLNQPGNLDAVACKLVCPSSGIKMEVYTNEPGIQLYSGNFLNGTDIGKKGIAYQSRSAVCLEAQHFPDSPHQPSFPTTVLQKDSVYHSRCIYKFGLE